MRKRVTLIFVSLLIMIISSIIYTKTKVSPTQSIKIVHNHHFETPASITVQITNDKRIQQVRRFFDTIDYRHPSNQFESPEYYDGNGYDYISFYSDGELKNQFTISGQFIQFSSGSIWYIMSEQSMLEWRSYIEDLKDGSNENILYD